MKKKWTTIFTVATVTVSMGLFASCSSTPTTTAESTELPAEVTTDLPSDTTSYSSESTGAVVDTASPPTYLADASSTSSVSDAAPAYSAPSPVNLGASSAGRSH